MGIIEFHLHEPDFDFSPSMGTGRSKDRDKTGLGEESSDLDTEWSPEDSGSSSRGPGKFVGLAMLVVLGALIAWRRRSGGTDTTEELDTQDEVEVYS